MTLELQYVVLSELATMDYVIHLCIVVRVTAADIPHDFEAL